MTTDGGGTCGSCGHGTPLPGQLPKSRDQGGYQVKSDISRRAELST